MDKQLNIYEKIAKLRQSVSASNPKKTGDNKFAGYKYYELGDFLPLVTKLEQEIGLLSKFSLKDDLGTLEVIDTENPQERETFTVDCAEANMKGQLEIQKAGAEITYTKRYAYQNYLNLTENDSVDGKELEPTKTKKEKAEAAKKAPVEPIVVSDQTEVPPFMESFTDTFAVDGDRLAALNEISKLLGDDATKVTQWLTRYGTTPETLTPSVTITLITRIKERQKQVK